MATSRGLVDLMMSLIWGGQVVRKQQEEDKAYPRRLGFSDLNIPVEHGRVHEA